MSKFKKEPKCEKCCIEEATAFVCIDGKSPSGIGSWKFCCKCTSDEESYYIPIDNFFSHPAVTVDWLAHMHEKTWMNWNDFMDMITRFRKATNSFGAR